MPLGEVPVPTQLGDLNYIFFYDDPKTPESGFGTGLVRLVSALQTDLDWIREHTRLLARATEWKASNNAENRLLFGPDIAAAKDWALCRPASAPEPTALHYDFMRASEEFEIARSNVARRQIEEMAAANAERETAIAERERAFQQAAIFRLRRARWRVAALAGLALLCCASAVMWWRADVAAKHYRALFDEGMATTHTLYIAASNWAIASAQFSDTAHQFPNRSPIFWEKATYGLNRTDPFMQIADSGVRMFEELCQGKNTFILNALSLDGGHVRRDCQVSFAISLLAKGDAYLSDGDTKTAEGDYSKIIDLLEVEWPRTKTDSRYDPQKNYLAARAHGRLAMIAIERKDAQAARKSLAKGNEALSRISEDDDVGPLNSLEKEKEWLQLRQQELKIDTVTGKMP
jgi:hypothetical protein